MTDDWKGEHLIRGRKAGIEELRRLQNLIYHKRRKAAGIPPAGKTAHDAIFPKPYRRKKPDAAT